MMLKCSKEAFAACPDRPLCGCLEGATFAEGSECDKFNRQIMDKPITNADRIRAMSDEELEWFINHFDICDLRTYEECKISYCAVCSQCVLDWLQQPAENPVKWSKPGPCPVTPEQFGAIYNDEEEPT